MTLQEYVEHRKKELDEFLQYNEAKLKQHGDSWLPEEQEPGDWYEQEDAWLQMKHDGDLT